MSLEEKKAMPRGRRKEISLKMTLLSDTIFGNGMSIPGGEDISVLTDAQGFPYYKGSTFKGVFREEMDRVLAWEQQNGNGLIHALFGEGSPGTENKEDNFRRLVFSDFTLSAYVREIILAEIGNNPGSVLDCLSNIRAFTRISDAGTAEKGSLRYARCLNQGLVFYSTLICSEEDEERIIETLPYVKWVGTMRNRGFGNVCIEVVDARMGGEEKAND